MTGTSRMPAAARVLPWLVLIVATVVAVATGTSWVAGSALIGVPVVLVLVLRHLRRWRERPATDDTGDLLERVESTPAESVDGFSRTECEQHLSEVLRCASTSRTELSRIVSHVEYHREQLSEAERELNAYASQRQEMLQRLVDADTDTEEQTATELADCEARLTTARRIADNRRNNLNRETSKEETLRNNLQQLNTRRSHLLQRMRELEGVPDPRCCEGSVSVQQHWTVRPLDGIAPLPIRRVEAADAVTALTDYLGCGSLPTSTRFTWNGKVWQSATLGHHDPGESASADMLTEGDQPHGWTVTATWAAPDWPVPDDNRPQHLPPSDAPVKWDVYAGWSDERASTYKQIATLPAESPEEALMAACRLNPDVGLDVNTVHDFGFSGPHGRELSVITSRDVVAYAHAVLTVEPLSDHPSAAVHRVTVKAVRQGDDPEEEVITRLTDHEYLNDDVWDD